MTFNWTRLYEQLLQRFPEDTVEDALERFWRRLVLAPVRTRGRRRRPGPPTFSTHDAVLHYLNRVAHREVLREARRVRNRAPHVSLEMVPYLCADGGRPDMTALARIQLDRIADQEPYVIPYVLGITENVKPGTVKSRLSRARRRLQDE